MKNINDFIKENIDEVMKQEMDAAEEQYNKKMSHSSELEESYKSNLTKQYENDRKSIEEQMKELQDKLKKLDEQKDQLYQPLEEKLDDYQKRKEKRENSYQEEYKELLTKANDDANQKEFLLRQKNEEFEKFKDATKMILKDWSIELVETNSDTKTKFSIVTPDTREIGFSFDYNNPEKPFFFIQDGNDKTEPVREECSAIEAAYILKEVALETSRQLKWFKNKDNEYSLDLTRVTQNAFKEAKDINYEFDIPRLGKQQEELLEYYNDYFRSQRGDIEQTAEVLSQLEEVNDALTKDEQNTKKKIQEDNKRLEELKRQQEEAQTEEEKELIRKEIEELTNNQKERHSFLENLKETKDDFKDKISTFWIHTVNGVQANIAKAQLTIREAQENIKNWVEKGGVKKTFQAAAVIGVIAILSIKKPPVDDNTKTKEKESVMYNLDCGDGRTVTAISPEAAQRACDYKKPTEEKAPVRTTLTKPTGYTQKELSEEVEPEKISEVSIKMDNYAEQDKQINVLEEKEIIKIDELDNDKKLEKVEENIKSGETVMEIKNNTIDNAYQVEQKVEEIKEEEKNNISVPKQNEKEEIEPEITVSENKENNSIDYSTSINTKDEQGKKETIKITMSAENVTIEEAPEILNNYREEAEKEQIKNEEQIISRGDYSREY